MSIQRVGLIGLGEVGSILADDLLAGTGVVLRVWDCLLDVADSPAANSFERIAGHSRVERAASAAETAVGCDLVLSAVTADEALDAADSILAGLEQDAWFVDFNSVSPGTKCQLHELVEAAGGRFVEAAVMSPIMPRRSASPVLLSGPNATAFVETGRGLGFTGMAVASERPGVAAATKMCRSVVVKGMEALVSESLLAARYYGVDRAVLESLNDLFPRPDWPDHARYLIGRTLQHGTRRAAEMREAARAVSEAGIAPWMSEGCVKRQDWAPQFSHLLVEESLEGLLDAVRAQVTSEHEF